MKLHPIIRCLVAFILLLAAVIVPLSMTGGGTSSTRKETYGRPALVQVDYDYVTPPTAAQQQQNPGWQGGRKFSKATFKGDTLMVYFGVAALFGFLAGIVVAWRSPPHASVGSSVIR